MREEEPANNETPDEGELGRKEPQKEESDASEKESATEQDRLEISEAESLFLSDDRSIIVRNERGMKNSCAAATWRAFHLDCSSTARL
jgi:hypothetical protein